MFSSMRVICVLLCNVPEDDGNWWMDEHQVTHITVTVRMSPEDVCGCYRLILCAGKAVECDKV